MIVRQRRSVASWFYRITMRPYVRYVSAGMLVGGWSFAMLAANAPFPQGTDDTAVHLAFAGTVLGGGLGMFGILAGVSRWVAEPAARKVMAEHMRLGASAHPELISRAEWDAKHAKVVDDVSGISGDIKVLTKEVQSALNAIGRDTKA